jgi:adenylate cyclase
MGTPKIGELLSGHMSNGVCMLRVGRFFREKNFLPRAAWVAILTAAVGLAFLTFFGGLEEAYGLGLLQRMRGPAAPPSAAILVPIEAESISRLGLPSKLQCWPRAIHAPLVRTLAEAGAGAILFDMFFLEDGPSDGPFLDAVRASNRVVLARKAEQDDNGPTRMVRGQSPGPAFALAASAVAATPLSLLAGRVTRFTVFGADDEPAAPAIAVQLAAGDVAPDWARLLAAEFDVPPDALLWTGSSMPDSMRELRRRLKNDSTSATRLARSIALLPAAKAKRLAVLLDLYRGESERLINWRGPAGAITARQYWRFVQTDSTPEQMPDDAACPMPLGVLNPQPRQLAPTEHAQISRKIFVIGATQDDNDKYATPFGDVSGAEILANAIGDLADGQSIRMSPFAEIAVVLALAAAMGAAAAFGTGSTLVIIAAVTAVGIFGLGYWLLVAANLFVPMFTPALVEIPAGALFSTGALWLEERRGRLNLENRLKRAFPSETVRQLLGGPIPANSIPQGHVAPIVCLASDAQGFATVSERLQPGRLREVMTDYIASLRGPVETHGGVVADLAGDGLICYWLAESDPVQARTQAIMAALDMREAVRSFNSRHPEEMLPTRFGIHAGNASFGPVQGEAFLAPMLVGDVVNTACRLQALNKELNTSTLASEEACEGVIGIMTRRKEFQRLKGKAKPIAVLEVLGKDPNAIRTR